MTVRLRWDNDMAQDRAEMVREAVADAAATIMLRANRVAPRRSGALIASSEVVEDPSGYRWTWQYRVPYAARQHFRNPTRGFWLRSTVDAESGQLERVIAAAARQTEGLYGRKMRARRR